MEELEQIDDGIEETVDNEKIQDEIRELAKTRITLYNFGKTYESADKLIHIMDESINNHYGNILEEQEDMKNHHKAISINSPIHKKSDLWTSLQIYKKVVKEMQIAVSYKDNQIMIYQNLLNQIGDLITELGDVNTEKVKLEAKTVYDQKQVDSLTKAIDVVGKQYERTVQILEADIERLGKVIVDLGAKHHSITPKTKPTPTPDVPPTPTEITVAPLAKYVNKDKLEEYESQGEFKKLTPFLRQMLDGGVVDINDLGKYVPDIQSTLNTLIDERQLLQPEIRSLVRE